jgi:hypothetical protein
VTGLPKTSVAGGIRITLDAKVSSAEVAESTKKSAAPPTRCSRMTPSAQSATCSIQPLAVGEKSMNPASRTIAATPSQNQTE